MPLNSLSCGVSLLTLTAAMIAGPAFAAGAAGIAPADGATLEEVVVTAQKREESLQHVPIAISALTANAVAARGITGTEDLAAVVPGLQMQRQYSSSIPFLRGIGSVNTSVGDESGTALYVDGVYRPSMPGGLFDFNSIARIEVLKGPQGTLFGRNALGGVINVVTKDPSQKPSADVQVGYGSYSTFEGSLYATGGLTSNIAADVAIYYKNQAKGYVRNLFDNEDVFKNKEFAARTKVRWASSDGDTEATVSADYDRYFAETGIGSRAVGNSVLLDGSRSKGFYNVEVNVSPVGRTEQYGASLTFKHDLSWAKFVSISSYRNLNPLLLADQDSTKLRIVDIDQHGPQRTYSQEFQLLSPTASRISWVAGLFYYNDRARADPLLLAGSAFPGGFRRTESELRTKSYAAFAQVTVPIFADTNFTAGLRWTRDERHVTGRSFAPPAIAPPAGLVPNSIADQKASFSKVTYRFVLDHRFTDDVMAYVSASRGFKSGVYTLVTPTDPAVRPAVLDAYEVGMKTQVFDNRLRVNGAAFFYKYNDIQLNQVIVGVSRLLNAARAEVKGLDLDADAAVTSRLHVQAGLSYLHGRFTDFPNAPSFIPRVNAQGVPVGGNVQIVIPNAAGNKTIQTPPFTASIGAQYRIPTSFGEITASGNAYYTSGFYWNADNRLKQPRYTLVNATIGWSSPDERWDVKIWGKNLGSAKYYSYETASGVGDIGSPAAPLTFGVTVGAHF